jgi:hypothetical protein
MSCELINQTPLSVKLHPHIDTTGRRLMLLIAKATWRIDTGRLAPPEQQVAVFNQPQSLSLGEFDLDDAQRAALGKREQDKVTRLDHDLVPPKPQFDLLVAGYVTPPEAHRGLKIKAAISVDSRQAILEAHAPRFWLKGLTGHTIEFGAKRLHRTPMSYAVADFQAGFPLETQENHPQQLPWLQRPGVTARRKHHDKHPAGFGYWPENAAHRQCHSGTYDKAWEQERKPLPPKDFSNRFFNCAHPDLQWPQPLMPSTEIRLIHLAESPELTLKMPGLKLATQASTADGTVLPSVALTPDTLTIEPDQQRMTLVQRTALPEGRGAQALSTVRLYRPKGG